MNKLSILILMLVSMQINAEEQHVIGIYTWGFENSILVSCENQNRYVALGPGLLAYGK